MELSKTCFIFELSTNNIKHKTMQNAQSVSTEILRQLGGKRFLLMTGSSNLLFAGITESNDKVWLRMNLKRNKAGANRLKVYYNSDDTYTMRFYKQTISKKTLDVKITKEQVFDKVYNDQLQSIFTDVTGLYTRL